jgi:cytoskeletal protein CcmA (bactofilin family)
MSSIKRSQRILRRILLFLVALIVMPALCAVAPGWSRDRPEFQEQITITAQQIINDDLYLSGDIITIDGLVKGDAVLAAKQITVNGTVEGDLLAAAQVITINGTVDDDVRMAGQVLRLGESAQVRDDVIAAGFSLESKTGSTIGGNLDFASGQALLAGTVQQRVRGASAALQIDGRVDGNVNLVVGHYEPFRPPFMPKPLVEIPKVPPGLTLTDTARINGRLTYRSEIEANVSQEAVVAGAIMYHGAEAEPLPTPAWIVLQHLRRLVTLALIGWLLLWFLPTWTQTLASTIEAKPLSTFGWGIVTGLAVWLGAIAILIGTGILTALFALTLQGLTLPVLGIGSLLWLALVISFGTFAGFVPQVIISFLGGRWLLEKTRPDRLPNHWTALLIGLIIFVILTAIPILGVLLNGIVILLGLGALWLWWRSTRTSDVKQSLTAV